MTRSYRSLMPVIRAYLLAATAALVANAQAATLVELVGKARGYDAAYAAAEKQIGISETQADLARTGLRPSLGLALTASSTQLESYAANSSQSLGLEASQTLFDRSTNALAEQARFKIELARAQLTQAEQDLMVRVAQAYFDLLSARAQAETVAAAKKAVQVQLQRAQRNFEVGLATITDTREAQAQFDRIVANEIAANNDVKVKQLALDQLIGQPNVKASDVARDVALPALAPNDVTVWIGQALANNPSVQMAKIATRSTDLGITKAEAGHLPTVTLSYAYSKPFDATCNAASGSGCTVNKLSLNMKMPIFAGYAVQNQVKEAVANSAQSKDQLEQAKRGVAQAIRSAYFGVLSGHAQVKALEAAVASSQSALEANQTGYDVGVRINADVLSAQSQLYQTQSDLAKARYSVLLGELKLRQLAGTLSVSDLDRLKPLFR